MAPGLDACLVPSFKNDARLEPDAVGDLGLDGGGDGVEREMYSPPSAGGPSLRNILYIAQRYDSHSYYD